MTRFVDYGINVHHDFAEPLNNYLPDGWKIVDEWTTLRFQSLCINDFTILLYAQDCTEPYNWYIDDEEYQKKVMMVLKAAKDKKEPASEQHAERKYAATKASIDEAYESLLVVKR